MSWIFQNPVKGGVSDIHITKGLPPVFRQDGRSIGGTPPDSRSSVAWLSNAIFNSFSTCANSDDDVLLIVLSVPGGSAEETDW